jgi:hypothetical protein
MLRSWKVRPHNRPLHRVIMGYIRSSGYCDMLSTLRQSYPPCRRHNGHQAFDQDPRYDLRYYEVFRGRSSFHRSDRKIWKNRCGGCECWDGECRTDRRRRRRWMVGRYDSQPPQYAPLCTPLCPRTRSVYERCFHLDHVRRRHGRRSWSLVLRFHEACCSSPRQFSFNGISWAEGFELDPWVVRTRTMFDL